MYSVAVGVALGISVGVLKILQGWNLTYMLLITYAVAIALTVSFICPRPSPSPITHTPTPSLPPLPSPRLCQTKHSRASRGTAQARLRAR